MTRYELSSSSDLTILEGIELFEEISSEIGINSIQSPVIYPDYYAIEIPTSNIGDIEFAIYGEALGGSKNISSLITVSIIPRPIENIASVTNMAPFFASDPSTEDFDIA